MRMIILNHAQLKNQFQNRLDALDPKDLRSILGLRRMKSAEMALPLAEILALLCSYRVSGYRHLKAFWVGKALLARAAGAGFISYANFAKWARRSWRLLAMWVEDSLARLVQGLGFVDSTKLPIAESCRWVKAMGRQAGRGHSSTGEFYGMKLHVLVKEGGRLAAMAVTPGNVNDRQPIKDGMLAGQSGLVYADRGYVSEELYWKMMEQNLLLVARPLDGMGHATEWSFEQVRNWDLRHKKRYRKRQAVERWFGRAKGEFGLSIKGLRNPQMAKAHIYSACLMMQWEALGKLPIERIL